MRHMSEQTTNIPMGYKPSPLGIIPEDWEVKRLGDLVTRLTNGITYDVSVTTGKPVSRIETISNGEINYLKVGYIEDTRGLETYKMQIGDILYSHINSLAHIGKVAFYDGKQELYHGMNLLLLRANNCIDSKFLYICLLTSQAKHAAQTMAKPAVNQASISTEDIKKIRLAIPPIEEQERICNVLQLWDTAISKQTALIEMLTLRKRGLMQQLLTGKKRLKGFSGEWKRIKLGDIAERNTRKNEEDNQNVVTISAQRGFVVQTDFFNKSVASETLDNYFLVHKDEFCYNKSYSNGYPMGAIKRLKSFDKAVVTTLYICFRLKGKPQTNIDFFEQYCESGLLNKELVKVANEGGRAHGLLNVTPADFFNMHMRFPSIEEQTAIASVLVNADKEIEIQKQKMAAMQEQKKGLMQVLLTGMKRIK